jgi:hypothetical protein
MSNVLSSSPSNERNAMGFKDVIDDFCRLDIESGGMWNQLKDFVDGLRHSNIFTLKESIQLMASAMIDRVVPTFLKVSSLFSKQFFTMDLNDQLQPVCGIVWYYLQDYLREAERSLFRNSFNSDWMRMGLNHTNSLINELCFEAYCLAHIEEIIRSTTILHDFRVDADIVSVSKIKTILLSGDTPSPEVVTNAFKPGAYLFILKKWNCRYVHAVLKIVKVEGKKRLRRKTTWLIPIHITVRNPKEKATCLKLLSE